MNWNEYYQNPLTITGLLSNLYGQKEFISTIVEISPKSIIEIGTGSGGMSIFLSWLGFSVEGVDIDPKVVAKATAEAQRLNSSAKFIVADAFHLPHPDGSFDLAFHQGLLEHFTDQEIYQLLDEQLRVARRVVFSVPNSYYPRRDYGNERLMTKAQWESILSRYQVSLSQNYSRKFFPKFYLIRPKIQYMAVVEKRT